MGFIGSLAEAAKSCLRGVIAAFGLGELHWGSLQFRKAVLALRCQQQSIHLREKSIAYPTERSKMRSILKLAGKDMRFSMKMMFAAGS